MHYHVEVWLPDVPASRIVAEHVLQKELAPFEEDHWDWWVIGGRWTGEHDHYDPRKDPVNVESCDICGGTGDRPGWVTYVNGVRTFTADPGTSSTAKWSRDCNGCNGCHGTGRSIKMEFAPHDGDIMPVTKLSPKMSAAAVVIGEQWIELEEGQTVISVLQEYLRTDCTLGCLITVDCHN